MQQLSLGSSAALIMANGFFAKAERKLYVKKNLAAASSFFQQAKDNYEIALNQSLDIAKREDAVFKLGESKRNLEEILRRKVLSQ